MILVWPASRVKLMFRSTTASSKASDTSSKTTIGASGSTAPVGLAYGQSQTSLIEQRDQQTRDEKVHSNHRYRRCHDGIGSGATDALRSAT